MFVFGKEQLRAMVGMYILGRSSGDTKQPRTPMPGVVDYDFYLEGYDDAVGALRQGLSLQRAAHVAKGQDTEEGFARRQFLYGLRKACEDCLGNDHQVQAAIANFGSRVIDERRDFFAGAPACPFDRGGPLDTFDAFSAREHARAERVKAEQAEAERATRDEAAARSPHGDFGRGAHDPD